MTQFYFCDNWQKFKSAIAVYHDVDKKIYKQAQINNRSNNIAFMHFEVDRMIEVVIVKIIFNSFAIKSLILYILKDMWQD